MTERLKRCTVRNCNELIPLTAETCGRPVCPKCGETHTEYRKNTRKIPENAKRCAACLSAAQKGNVAARESYSPGRKQQRQAELSAAVEARKPLPAEHLNQEMLRRRMMRGVVV